jgi:hypothetical protein
MKNLILLSLLFVSLGLRAAHFTDVISEKQKPEYNVLNYQFPTDFVVVADSAESNYFTSVDSWQEKIVAFTPSVKPIDIVNLQVWRNLQSHRQSKNGDEHGIETELLAQIKAPPLI